MLIILHIVEPVQLMEMYSSCFITRMLDLVTIRVSSEVKPPESRCISKRKTVFHHL